MTKEEAKAFWKPYLEDALSMACKDALMAIKIDEDGSHVSWMAPTYLPRHPLDLISGNGLETTGTFYPGVTDLFELLFKHFAPTEKWLYEVSMRSRITDGKIEVGGNNMMLRRMIKAITEAYDLEPFQETRSNPGYSYPVGSGGTIHHECEKPEEGNI